MSEDSVKQESIEQAGPLPDPWIQGKTVEVSVETQVTRDQLHAALDKILDVSGCAGCGMNGFDIHLLGQQELATNQLQGIEGVKSVRLISRQVG